MNSNIPYHIPVLRDACMEGLDIQPNGTYVDITFGGGGHSRAILERLGPGGRLFSFDQDSDAQRNIPSDERFTFVWSNFRYLYRWMRYYDIDGFDGIMADLGVSSHHFDDETRGFSFRFDGPLDMRMNNIGGVTAADFCNTATVEELTHIFRLYGELRQGYRLGNAIVKRREHQPFERVEDLVEVVRPLLHPAREKKDMAKVFQALRIKVNGEMEALEEVLEAAIRCLRPGGRLVVLTYHSLEDRMVKNFIRAGRLDGKVETDFYGHRHSPFTPINKKVILPTDKEMEENPRSRSAKLRIAVRNIDEIPLDNAER